MDFFREQHHSNHALALFNSGALSLRPRNHPADVGDAGKSVAPYLTFTQAPPPDISVRCNKLSTEECQFQFSIFLRWRLANSRFSRKDNRMMEERCAAFCFRTRFLFDVGAFLPLGTRLCVRNKSRGSRPGSGCGRGQTAGRRLAQVRVAASECRA